MPLTLDDIMDRPNLPSLPGVAVKVLELTRDADVKLKEISAVVENDPALCAKILRTVNSSFYGLSKPCPTISRALAYLGLSTVKSLVLGFSLVDIAKKTDDDLDMVAYFRQSIYSAAAARRFASRHGQCDADEAFVAALMQDIGMLAIQAADGASYARLVNSQGENHLGVPHCEREVYGFDHGEVGATLGAKWKLPASLVTAIRYHHNADQAPDHVEIVRTVDIACRAALTLSMQDHRDVRNALRDRASEWFGLGRDDVNELMSEIAEDATALSSVFRLDTGKAPDVSAILAEAQEATVLHQIAVGREAEELREANSELAKQATTDTLTGIANRGRFDEELLRAFGQVRQFKGTMGVILCDLDKFKSVNDTHGHQVGDEVIVEVARRMADCVRGTDTLCRYGGEEFAVVLPGADRRAAAAIAERIRLRIEETPIDLSAVPDAVPSIDVTSSFGVAVYDASTATLFSRPEIITQAADRALYAAKEAGRNCVRMHTARPASRVA